MKFIGHSSFQRLLRVLSVFRGPSLLCAMLVLAPLVLLALAGTQQIAWKGKGAETLPSWPEGTSNLVNDPVRADGWNPWFSELPNDVYHYELQIRNMEDVERLLAKLAAIKANKVQVQLDPLSKATHLGWVSEVDPKKSIGAIFSIGNQEVLDHWYDRLEKEKSDASIGGALKEQVRVFGVNRLTNAPTALPPTLTLYVGHEAIDLKKLSFPPGIEVQSGVPDWYRKNHQNDPLIKAIDKIVAQAGNTAVDRFLLPVLEKEQRAALVKEAQQAYSRFARLDPKERGQAIPRKFWGPIMLSLNPRRVVDDRVNIKIVTAEGAGTEAGFYINLAISSYAPKREDFLDFDLISEPGDEPLGNVYRYKAVTPEKVGP